MKWAAVIEYIADPSKVAEVRPHHRVYLTGLLEAGKLVCAGPFLDDFGALIVYEAFSHHLMRHGAEAFSQRFGTECLQPWLNTNR